MSVSLNGQVKWFNNKAGYGFITVTSDEHKDEDIFVHHSAIQTNQDAYKYLVQGEHVSLNWDTIESDTHSCQAADVKGINGAKLMCETRASRPRNKSRSKPSKEVILKDENGAEWVLRKSN